MILSKTYRCIVLPNVRQSLSRFGSIGLKFPSFLETTEQERSQRSSALIVLHPDVALAPSLPEVLLAGQGEGLRHKYLAVVKVFVMTRSMDKYREFFASYRKNSEAMAYAYRVIWLLVK
jgi:hypothetical protein